MRLYRTLRLLPEKEIEQIYAYNEDEKVRSKCEFCGTVYELSADEIRADLEHGDGLAPIRSELLKRKALEWLAETVTLVDEDGAVIDRADLELPVAESTDDDEDDEPAMEPTEETDE